MPRGGASTRQKNRLQGIVETLGHSQPSGHLVDASAGLYDDQPSTTVALPSNLKEVIVTLTPTGRSSRLQEAIPPIYGPRPPLPHTFMDCFGDLAPLQTTATDTSSSFSSRAATLTLDCALVAKFNSPSSVTLPMDLDPLTPESIPVASPSAPLLMELSSESSGDEIFRRSGRSRAPIYSSDSELDTPKSVPERSAQSSADPQVLLTRLSPSIIKKYKRVPFRIPKKIQSSSSLLNHPPSTQRIKSAIKRTNQGEKDQYFG